MLSNYYVQALSVGGGRGFQSEYALILLLQSADQWWRQTEGRQIREIHAVLSVWVPRVCEFQGGKGSWRRRLEVHCRTIRSLPGREGGKDASSKG